MSRVFAATFGLAFGLAAAGNLPPSPAPSTAAVVVLVLGAMWAAYRAGLLRHRADLDLLHRMQRREESWAAAAAAERVAAAESKTTEADRLLPIPLVFTPPGNVPPLVDLSNWHSPPPSFATEPHPDRVPSTGTDDLEAAALLEDEYGQRVPPQLAGQIVREMYADRQTSVTGEEPSTSVTRT